MKKYFWLLTLVCAVSLSAWAAPSSTPAKSLFVDSSQIAWQNTDTTGVQMAIAQGENPNGPHHMFMKFSPGFSAPMHYHTADHFVTVLAGTIVLTVDGKEHRLTPGSYFVFNGKKQHSTACEAGAECILSADVRGKWDVVMATNPKGK